MSKHNEQQLQLQKLLERDLSLTPQQFDSVMNSLGRQMYSIARQVLKTHMRDENAITKMPLDTAELIAGIFCEDALKIKDSEEDLEEREKHILNLVTVNRIEPNDKIVISLPDNCSRNAVMHMKKQAEKFFGREVLTMQDGMLKIFREKEEDGRQD